MLYEVITEPGKLTRHQSVGVAFRLAVIDELEILPVGVIFQPVREKIKQLRSRLRIVTMLV